MIRVLDSVRVRLLKVNIRQKIGSAGIYLLVPIVNFSLSIVTTPLFAKFLSAEEFGILGYFTSLSTFITCFYGLLFQTYYMSIYFRESEDRRKAILVSLILASVLWNIIFFPVSYFLLKLYFIYTESVTTFFPYALLALSAAVISGYKGFVQVNYRLNAKPLFYFFITGGYRILVTVISLYLVMTLNLGLVGRMTGIFIVELFFFIYSIRQILKDQDIKIEKEVIRSAFKVVLPLFPASFFFLPLGSFDNIVLARMNQYSEMGIYNIGKGIASYLYIGLFPFYQVFEPLIYRAIAEKKTKSLKYLALGLTLMVLGASICFWLVSPYIINYLTSGRYNESLKYANILVLSNALLILFSFLDAILNALQETKKHLLINTAVAIFCVLSYSVSALYFQQVGVAYAVVGTHFLLIALQSSFIWKKLDEIDTEVRSLILADA